MTPLVWHDVTAYAVGFRISHRGNRTRDAQLDLRIIAVTAHGLSGATIRIGCHRRWSCAGQFCMFGFRAAKRPVPSLAGEYRR